MISTQNLTQINIKIASSLGKIIPCVYHFTSQGSCVWRRQECQPLNIVNATLHKNK